MVTICRLCGLPKSKEQIESEINESIERKLLACCRWQNFQGCKYQHLPKGVCNDCFKCLEWSWAFAENVKRVQCTLINQFQEESKNSSRISKLHLDKGETRIEKTELRPQSWCPELNERIKKEESIVIQEKRDDDFPKTSKDTIFPYCLKINDFNVDGTVKPEAISRLKLINWTLVQKHCNECNQCFTDEHEFIKHFKQDHRLEQIRYKCKLCKKSRSYTRRRMYYQHIIKHHIPYLAYCCRSCNQFFWDLKHLKQHKPDNKKNCESSEHASAEPVLCDQCGDPFYSKSSLRQHQNLKHPLDDQKFECFLCKEKFYVRSKLAYHMFKHVPKRKVQCPECNATFTRRYTLKLHLRTHSDIYSFNCSYCAKAFKFADRLKNHERIHTGERPYLCKDEKCDYRTGDTGNYYTHMRLKHGISCRKLNVERK